MMLDQIVNLLDFNNTYNRRRIIVLTLLMFMALC